MWEYYNNNIYLLFLPPHTSHVLQPLDLSVFAPLKRAYRKELGYLSLLTDSTPIGKRNFLGCYQKARKSALISTNIKLGWKATGLWPTSMSKPLISRLLLENSNTQGGLASITPGNEDILNWDLRKSNIDWITPEKSQDIRDQARQFLALPDSGPSTCRVLFRKITKSLDNKDFTITSHQLRIQQLEARVEQLAPRKRRKVQTSPNSRFATIRAIQEAQIQAGDRQVILNESELSEDSISIGDCIEVEE